MSFLQNDLVWWITAIEVPVLAGLFGLIWHVRQDSETACDDLQTQMERRCEQLREALSAFKLEVAKTYASQTDLRDLEGRLVSHLLRIESKLDATALKAEAARAKIST
ncbi:MAG: hypothetical protein L6Q57_02710 [Alphaproteobacteria bacterium]|nr:hypothetical protein [Alphaproteobacteria bacterium]